MLSYASCLLSRDYGFQCNTPAALKELKPDGKGGVAADIFLAVAAW